MSKHNSRVSSKDGNGDSPSPAQQLFLRHLDKIQRALDSMERHQVIGLHILLRSGRSLRRPEVRKFYDQRISTIDDDGSVHHRCCVCTATTAWEAMLANQSSLAQKSIDWLSLPQRRHEQWRSIGTVDPSEVLADRTFTYSARCLTTFSEYAVDDLADEVVDCLLENSAHWMENPERSYSGQLALILYQMGMYLRRKGKTYEEQRFSNLLQKGGWIRKLIEDFESFDMHSRVLGLPGLLLWREIPSETAPRMVRDAFGRVVDQEKVQDQSHYLKQLACQTVQKGIFEDPVWSDDGRWGYDIGKTFELTLGWLGFWEYYLLGEDLEEFPRLAGTENQAVSAGKSCS